MKAKRRGTPLANMLDMLCQNQFGAFIGLVAGCLALTAGLTAVTLSRFEALATRAFANMGAEPLSGAWVAALVAGVCLLASGISAYCFIQWTSDRDVKWLLTVAFAFTGGLGWIVICLGAVVGAALQERVAGRG